MLTVETTDWKLKDIIETVVRVGVCRIHPDPKWSGILLAVYEKDSCQA